MRSPANDRGAASAPVLKTELLSVRFGGLAALSAVNFEVARDEVRAIIGPNGAGKSTFFNCLTGVLRPTSGRIIFDGQDITGLPSNAISQRGIARSYQITNILPNATVLENVRIAAQSRRHAWNMVSHHGAFADINQKAEAALHSVGLLGKAPSATSRPAGSGWGATENSSSTRRSRPPTGARPGRASRSSATCSRRPGPTRFDRVPAELRPAPDGRLRPGRRPEAFRGRARLPGPRLPQRLRGRLERLPFGPRYQPVVDDHGDESQGSPDDRRKGMSHGYPGRTDLAAPRSRASSTPSTRSATC